MAAEKAKWPIREEYKRMSSRKDGGGPRAVVPPTPGLSRAQPPVPAQQRTTYDRPAPDGPFGAKGPGEMCANPVLPAVANAIFNAVGVRIDELPITSEKLLRALHAQGGARLQTRW